MHSRRITLASLLAASLVCMAGCARRHTRISSAAPAPAASPRRRPPPMAREEIQAIDGTTGIASWYGVPYDGRQASDGEIYDMEKLTAAHRTLPFGTVLRVTNLSNQKSVDVRVIDRGPFIDGRIIDLSKAAARAIDMIGPGTAMVRLNLIDAPADPGPSLYAVQAGSFQDKSRAERLRDSLETEFAPVRLVQHGANPAFWRVLAGEQPTIEQANSLAAAVRRVTGQAFVVSLENVPAAPERSTH